MPDYREREIKLYVPDLHAVGKRLEAEHAVLAKTRIFERNVRYENAARSLTAEGIVLRLRQDTRVRLTYKQGSTRVDNSGVTERFEAEVEVSSFEAMDTILRQLGFEPYMTYEKYRTTYEWGHCEITLDEMPYGNFVEIEGDVECIARVRADLGLNDALACDGSYTVLFDRVRRALGLDFTDLTFDNFEGIVVPPHAFQA